MSTFFELTNEERQRLKNLNGDKATVFALKKLFLNVISNKPFSNETQELAAERIAIEWIKQTFYDLSVIKPERAEETEGINPAI